MPPLPDMPNTLRVDMKHTYSNDTDVLVRTFWTWAGTTPTNAMLDTVAGDVATAVNANLKSLEHSDVNLTETTVTDLTSDTAARGSSTTGVEGTLGGGVLGAQVCFLTGYTIGRRYRGGKPRTYWPFGDDTKLLDPQHWTNAFIDLVVAGVGAWQTAVLAIATGGMTITQQVNVSYYNGFKPVPGSTGRYRNVSLVRGSSMEAGPVIAPDPITALTYSAILATQRRRTTRKR